MNKTRLAALLAAALIPLTPATASAGTTTRTAAPAAHPNVVFILTDDMRADDMKYMDFTRRLFARNGTTFTQAISPHPLCCPARAELVTGQYAQNNGVHHNSGPNGGYQALVNSEQGKENLIFQWFKDAGYETGYIGKFMNHYDLKASDLTLPGLDHNEASVSRIYSAYNLITYHDGDPVQHPEHQIDYVTDWTNRQIQQADGDPFFMWVGYVAPHGMRSRRTGFGPPLPPPGYRTLDKQDLTPTALTMPSWNVANPTGRGHRVSRRYVRYWNSGRARSLYAVDDGVRRIVRTLKDTGEWDNTILAFASDNGYSLGEHRITGKNWAYQASLRVPLMLAGPGVPNARIGAVTTLVDLPGTLARLAGVTPGRAQDGADMFTLKRDRAVLIQAGAPHRLWWWRGVYTRRYTFVRWSNGPVELYDRDHDRYELRNRPHARPGKRLRTLLEELGTCVGQECQRTF